MPYLAWRFVARKRLENALKQMTAADSEKGAFPQTKCDVDISD